jgi:hypothetical protein
MIATPIQDIHKPLVLSEIVNVQDRREWWKHIKTRSKNELVQVHRQASHGVFEQELVHALELLQTASEPLYVTSIGSSCSTDQLPIYDFCQSLFDDNDVDVLAYFSSYTPMHDSLFLSCHDAVSTLCSRAYTSAVVNIGGGSVEWSFFENPTAEDDINFQAFDSYAAVTRTWNGHEFSLGWNSPHHLSLEDNSMAITRLTTRPGDVLIIPSFWWFQSRAKGPANISIHSKRCGVNDLPVLIQHILGDKEIISGGDPQDMVQQLFECIETR